MVSYIFRRIQFILLLCFLALGLSSQNAFPVPACSLPNTDFSSLKEKIQFAVKWSFIPLVKTSMETYQLVGEKPTFYRLTHQAAMNSFWNDRMDSIINSESFLPCQMETIIKDGKKHWKESIVFERHLGIARLFRQNREDGATIENIVDIAPTSMDPLSAFYYLRNRLSPSNPFLELKGITGSRRFSLRGRLAAPETIDVPAGSFKTYRFECSLEYWPQGNNLNEKDPNSVKRENHSFTLWVTQDYQRFPVQIRYNLLVGSLWVRAISLQYNDLLS